MVRAGTTVIRESVRLTVGINDTQTEDPGASRLKFVTILNS